MRGKYLQFFPCPFSAPRKNLEIFKGTVYDVSCKQNRRPLLFAHRARGSAGFVVRQKGADKTYLNQGGRKVPGRKNAPAENGQAACFVQATALTREVEIRNEQISQALGTGRGGAA